MNNTTPLKILSGDADIFFKDGNYAANFRTLTSVVRYFGIKDYLKTQKLNSIKVSHESDSTGFSGKELRICCVEDFDSVPYEIKTGNLWETHGSSKDIISNYLTRATPCIVCINKTYKRCIVYYEISTKTANTIKKILSQLDDLLSTILFKLLPWRFENDITDEDKRLFKAIADKDEQTYVDIMQSVAESVDFNRLNKMATLSEFHKRYMEKQIADLDCEIHNDKTTITRLQQDIDAALCSIRKNTELIELYKLKDVQSDDDDLVNFFMQYKQIDILDTMSSNAIYYVVRETLEFYDKDMFLRLYNGRDNEIKNAQRNTKRVLYGLFAENKGLLKVFAKFKISNFENIKAEKGVDTHDHTAYIPNYLKHPHLISMGCLGDNKNMVESYMAEGLWDQAVLQTVAATKNMYFQDTHAIRYLIEYVETYFDNSKCVIADNGQEMTPAEFYNYLTEGENNNVTTTENI